MPPQRRARAPRPQLTGPRRVTASVLRAGLTTATALVWLPFVDRGLAIAVPGWPPPGFAGELAGYVVFATLTAAVPALVWSLPGVSLGRFAVNAAVALVGLPLALAGTDSARGLEALTFALVGFALPGAVGLALVCVVWVFARSRWASRATA